MLSSLLLAGCASEEERGCVIVKRHSKAGKVALQAAARWCVSEYRPANTDKYLELIALAQYRVELGLAGPEHCDLGVPVHGQVDGVEYQRRFDCRIDVKVLDACLETASSVVDVTLCTEQATSRVQR